MPLALDAALDAIGRHTRGLADAARDHLDAPVTTCPGWSVADLVDHVTGVHRFWATVVGEGRRTPPPDPGGDGPTDGRPNADDDPVAALLAGAGHLVAVLGAADQSAPVWTWSPLQRDVAFVTRHQVQEALVHHFDALFARGDAEPDALGARPVVAADAVDEFLHRSLVLDSWPAEDLTAAAEELAALPDLPQAVVLHATDTGDAWEVAPGAHHATVRVARLAGTPATAVAAPAVHLLLWLYGRVDLPPASTAGAAPGALAGLRALCDTE